jgi:hypothetical protein
MTFEKRKYTLGPVSMSRQEARKELVSRKWEPASIRLLLDTPVNAAGRLFCGPFPAGPMMITLKD